MPNAKRLELWHVPAPEVSSWDVARVRRALRAHESGEFQESSLLADAMERSPRIRSALETRVLAVMGLPFAAQPSESTNGRKAESLAKRFGPLWPTIATRAVLQQALRWELRMGFCLCELTWKTTARGWTPKLHVVHPYNVRWDTTLNTLFVRTRTGELPVDFTDPRWVFFARSEESPWMNGIVRALGIREAISNIALTAWARRAEVHGIPIVKLMVPAKASEQDKDRLADDVEDMGAEGILTLAQGATPDASFDADLLEPADAKGELFDTLLRRVDGDIAIAVLGQNLTTEVSSGSLAAAKVHDRVRGDYLEADAMLIADVGQLQIASRWVFYNDPRTSDDGDEVAMLDARERAEALAPRPVYDPTPPDDAESKARALGLDADYLTKLDALGIDIEPLLKERGLVRLPEAERPAPEQAVPEDAEDDAEDADEEEPS
jgi:phage gp29-like protein